MEDPDVFLKWSKRTATTHINAITSLRLNVEPCDDAIWGAISSLPALKKLFIKIHSCDTDESWMPDESEKAAQAVKKVQQPSLERFDVVFNISDTSS